MPRKKRKAKVTDNSSFESALIKKIDECERVIEHLDVCPAWAIITKDLEEQRKLIDSNWHLTTDEKQLKEFRVTKFAIMHLLEIKVKYESDLSKAKEELKKYQNQDKETIKDYDTETTVEKD